MGDPLRAQYKVPSPACLTGRKVLWQKKIEDGPCYGCRLIYVVWMEIDLAKETHPPEKGGGVNRRILMVIVCIKVFRSL